MEPQKLTNYFDDFSKQMEIWQLDINLSQEIFSKIFLNQFVDLPKHLTMQKLNEVLPFHLTLEGINDKNGFLNILSALPYKVSFDEQVLLIWDIKDPIDVCTIDTLKTFWNYIWYGASDEMLIIFIPGKVVLMICDWSEVRWQGLENLISSTTI